MKHEIGFIFNPNQLPLIRAGIHFLALIEEE
jgi:hypothetical protein